MVFGGNDYGMEDSSSQNGNGGNISSVGNQYSVNKQIDEISQKPQYTIPGVLHFVQYEWSKFEVERSQWEIHKAELESKIAFLQGERKGQENLKNDLIRRIKMLEYALKQERSKYHQLKYGTELPEEEFPNLEMLTEGEEGEGEKPASTPPWQTGRGLLRHYLHEIGYTDTIIDLRTTKIRDMLGMAINSEVDMMGLGGLGGSDRSDSGTGDHFPLPAAEGNSDGASTSMKRGNDGPPFVARKSRKQAAMEAMILDSDAAAVMACDEFLTGSGTGMVMDDLEDEDDEEEDDGSQDVVDVSMVGVQPYGGGGSAGTLKNLDKICAGMDMDEDVDAEAEKVLNELHMLSETEEANAAAQDIRSHGGGMFIGGKESRNMGPEDRVDAANLGELAQLTVNNDADTYDSIAACGTSQECYRKTWTAKYTLRSHFDEVYTLAFHPVEPVLITASEDCTLKLWNLRKTVAPKKSASLDVEPLYTFRKHLKAVLSVVIDATGEQCYSGCAGGQIYSWNIPAAYADPYDSFEPNVLKCQFEGHTDAIWNLRLSSRRPHLLSCSADGTVRLWSAADSKPMFLASYVCDESEGNPTSADFIQDDSNQVVVSYTSGNCIVYDLETCKPVLKFDQLPRMPAFEQVNRVVCHPTLALAITAHEDKYIRFFDTSTGKCVHDMVAHLDSVTSLAIDPSGLFLLSGSHDCSLRLWNLDTKTCVQEITSHRKKYEQSIKDVAFHPSLPYIASAGADGLAKVFA